MSFLRKLDLVEKVDPEIAELILKELDRQVYGINLIASENYADEAVIQVQATVLTNKYAEGYPSRRYYSGCEMYDQIERIAVERVKQLFNAEHANVQPHSGSQANLAVYLAFLKPGDTVLAMDLAHGGHLTHGSSINFSGILYRFIHYGVDRSTELIDYDQVEKLALEYKPRMIVAGASAYPREIDFKRFREICDKVGAYLMVDMAHIAGLIAAGLHMNPVPYADFVTSTTQKTLKGPRGGFILCRREYAEAMDRAVFPGTQSGPLMHIIAAKAVAFKLASTEEFREYQRLIVRDARALASSLDSRGYRIVSGGTDNHLLLVDLKRLGVSGRNAQDVLEKTRIYVNKNLVPYDEKPPYITSGIRLGTSCVAARSMKESEMDTIARFIDTSLKNRRDSTILKKVEEEVIEFCKSFPIYGD
ncbi:serine hydroxymethyltransferase [Candidatus Bathyarchaeota archaeon]|nr:serine hydroxymethyltransferase [Candidatus Bathyarchaeota archaeon]